MSDKNDHHSSRITPLGQFFDTQQELEFQTEQLFLTRKRMRFLCIISDLAYLGAIYADCMQISGTDLAIMASARTLTALTGLIPILLSFKKNISPKRFGLAVAIYMGAVVCTEVLELVVKAGQIQLPETPLTAFIILLFYLYQAPQIWQPLLIGGLGSIAYLITLTTIAGVPAGYLPNTVLIFGLANGFGLYFSSQFGTSQRREYIALATLKTRAETDTLTGIFNRRRVMELGSRAFQAAKRYKQTYSVLLLDIDYFKQINDVHGHAAGDAVLTEFANRCRTSLRETDILGRIGGEEFLVFLPHASREQAVQTANRLLNIVGQTPFYSNDTAITVTTSIGVATISTDTLSIETIINAADTALYKAKSNGRNTLCEYV